MTWEYIAGFFDGEGSVTPRITMTVGVNISIAQSRERGRIVLEDIKAFLIYNGFDHVQVVVNEIHFPRLGKEKMYQLRIRSVPDSIKFLNCVMPYIRIKRTEAQDVLRARKLWPPLTGKQRGFIASERRWHYSKVS